MNGKTLVLGVSGGIAAYKVPDLISRLRKRGWNCEVILTRAAAEFVTPLTFREVSHNPVHLEMFDPNPQWEVEHISLAKQADCIAIIPATANIIGKIAAGIADDLLTTTIMAATCPKLIAPAMNSGMYQNPVVQNNLATLAKYGYGVVPPETGVLLCGDAGVGKLAAPEELEDYLEQMLAPQDLRGETILVTAGGTREPLDPIRFITNRSSGKMGHALAEAAFKRGATVTLITASELPVHIREIKVCRVETNRQMLQAVLDQAGKASIIIKAAAPADFRPESVATEKIKKNGDALNLRLVPNVDILMELGQRKTPGQLLVGFAAETQSLRENALLKLERKNLDLIIGNLVGSSEVGMGADTNRVVIYSGTDCVELPEQPKSALADQILTYIRKYQKERVLQSRT
jgi:phosphopantothenoylcysteine decarboxylase/phosphopantothenate--cysteine ligase